MLAAFPALESLHFNVEPRAKDVFSTRLPEAALLEHAAGLRKVHVDISKLREPHDNQLYRYSERMA